MIDLSKRPFPVQLIIWMTLGPFFLVAMLSALLMQSSDGHFVFSLIAMSGLLACWIWRLKGFVLAGSALLAALLVLDPDSLWVSACYALPILAALLLTALCMQEAHGLMVKRERNVHDLHQLKSGLEHERHQATLLKARLIEENRILKEQLDKQQKWNQSLKQLMDIGEQETNRLSQLRQNYLEKIKQYEYQIQELKVRVQELHESTRSTEPSQLASNSALLNQLNDLRVRHYQMELLSSQYRDQLKTLKPKLKMLAHLKADNIHLQHEVDILRARPDASEAVIELKQENVSLNRERQQKQELVLSLQSEVEQLAKQLENRPDRTEEINALHMRINELTKQLEEQPHASGEIEALQKQIKSLKADGKVGQLKQLRNQLEQKDKALIQARAGLFQTQEQLEAMNHEASDREHQINDEIRCLCKYITLLEQEMGSVESVNNELLLLVGQREDFAATGSDQ